MVSGWYPDPSGRFEYRYHNDRHWTSDVSANGQRYIDPLPTPTAAVAGQVPGPPEGDGGNGLAIASMVCGIVAVVIAWIPFIGLAGLAAAVVGLALSVPAMRRSKPHGARRGAAIAGLVTSAVGLVLGVLGIVFSIYLVRAIDRYDNPGPSSTTIASCTSDGPSVVAEGEITNESDRRRDYTVHVRLGPDNRVWVDVDDVPAGGSVPFEARGRGSFGDGACEVVEVRGPVPFDLDPTLFEQ